MVVNRHERLAIAAASYLRHLLYASKIRRKFSVSVTVYHRMTQGVEARKELWRLKKHPKQRQTIRVRNAVIVPFANRRA